MEVIPDIIVAAYKGNYKVVEDLLNSGVDVNTVDPRDNLTCLHIGCMNGDEPLIQIILDHNRRHNDVDFDIKSNFRPRAAWQFAINSNNPRLARMVDQEGRLNRGERLGKLDMDHS